jgi:hypothetical protein
MMARGTDREAGFAMLEAVAVLLLSSLIFVALAVAGGFIARHSGATVERANEIELLISGLDAWRRDVSAAFLPPFSPSVPAALAFRGTETSIGFLTASAGIEGTAEIVSIAAADSTLLRSAAPWRAFSPSARPPAAEPALLLSGPWRFRFAYVAPGGGEWQGGWEEDGVLPALVRLTVTARRDGRIIAEIVAPLHADGRPDCLPPSCGGALMAGGGDAG